MGAKPMELSVIEQFPDLESPILLEYVAYQEKMQTYTDSIFAITDNLYEITHTRPCDRSPLAEMARLLSFQIRAMRWNYLHRIEQERNQQGIPTA